MHAKVADTGISRRPIDFGPTLTTVDRDLVARAIADAIPPTGFPVEPVARREAIDQAAAELADRLSSDEGLSGDAS